MIFRNFFFVGMYLCSIFIEIILIVYTFNCILKCRYFHGKRRAEDSVLKSNSGLVLRPGFMYGTRYVSLPNNATLAIPLWLLGMPLESILSLPGFNQLKYIPGLRAAFSRPLSVDAVGDVIAHASVYNTNIIPLDTSQNWKTAGILNVDDIFQYSRDLRN